MIKFSNAFVKWIKCSKHIWWINSNTSWILTARFFKGCWKWVLLAMQVREKWRNWFQIKFANLILQWLTDIWPNMNLIDFSHSPLKREDVLVSWKTAPRKSIWEIIKMQDCDRVSRSFLYPGNALYYLLTLEKTFCSSLLFYHDSFFLFFLSLGTDIILYICLWIYVECFLMVAEALICCLSSALRIIPGFP